MNEYKVEVSKVIDAPASHLYAIVSDYNDGHQAILPKPYFTKMDVLAGGVGAGTKIEVHMAVMGQTVVYNMEVTEPEPGHILAEEDKIVNTYTTFTFDPVNNGAQTKVTIATRAQTSGGFKGWMEKMMNPPIARKIYHAELENLAIVAQQRTVSPA